MLVFSRKKNESFVIEVGDEIVKITLNDVFAGTKQAQIGVEAPKHIKIWRSEIYESILENKEASKTNTNLKKLEAFFKK